MGVFFTAIIAAIVEDSLRSPLEVVPLNAISNALGGTTSTPVAFARRKIVFLELISMIYGLLDITFSPRGAT